MKNEKGSLIYLFGQSICSPTKYRGEAKACFTGVSTDAFATSPDLYGFPHQGTNLCTQWNREGIGTLSLSGHLISLA